MSKLPPPRLVRELRGIQPDLQIFPSGTRLWRLHFRGGDHPSEWNEFRSFGPHNTARFDHHLKPRREQNRKIFYVATRGPVCIAEVFQDTRTIDRKGRTPWLVGFELRTDLQLLDLTGLWPTHAGASMAIGSSEARSRTQHWSRNIYAAYPNISGLLYASSMYGNAPAVALYERAQVCLPESPFFHEALTEPVLLNPLQNTADQLGYDLR